MDDARARYLKDFATAAVSVIGGWLITRATDNLFPGVAVAASIVAVSRAMLSGGIRGNRTVFLIAVLIAVAAYSLTLAWRIQDP